MTTKVFDAFTRLDASDVNDFLVNRPIQNFVINGAMQVAQRGTSSTGITTTGYYTADRFQTANTTLGTWTQTIENDAPTGTGFRKSLKVLCTTADATPAAADVFHVQQVFEGQNLQSVNKGTSNAKQLTVSFWVKSNVTGTYIAFLQDFDNSRIVSAAYTITSSGTWENKTITFPADTTGAFDNDNAASLALRFYLGAGSNLTSGTLQTTWAADVLANRAVGQANLGAATNNYWQITGVQLELGDIATEFQFQDIQKELAACQRYYETVNLPNSSVAVCQAISTTIAVGTLRFTTKRVTPTLAFNSAANFILRSSNNTSLNPTSLAIAEAGTSSLTLVPTLASGLVAGDATEMILGGTTGGFLAVSAEL
jgi:hypothetical protein